MCNIVEKLLMLKIGPLNLLIFPKSGSGIRQTTSGNIRYLESGKFDIRYIPSLDIRNFLLYISIIIIVNEYFVDTP